MVFQGKLPELIDLCRIARAVKSYPATTREVMEAAKEVGCSDEVVEFIKLFKYNSKPAFESRADFYVRAAELAMLTCEEREQPKEELWTTQG